MLIKNPHQNAFFTHVQSRNGRNYSNEILYIESLAGRSDIFKTASKLLQGFGRGTGANFCFSHRL